MVKVAAADCTEEQVDPLYFCVSCPVLMILCSGGMMNEPDAYTGAGGVRFRVFFILGFFDIFLFASLGFSLCHLKNLVRVEFAGYCCGRRRRRR
jgi:hypothetical protein